MGLLSLLCCAIRNLRFPLCPQVMLACSLVFSLSMTGTSAFAFQKSVRPFTPESRRSGPTPQQMGIVEHLGTRLPLDSYLFQDETGQTVSLSQYFHKKRPVILTLVYYKCPNLCNFLLNGFVTTLRKLSWTAGESFDIVTVSIDPRESYALAAKKREAYLQSYGRREAEKGWHFLTGSEDQIRSLSEAVGFGYTYDASSGQYAHSAALFLLTPDGELSRILYGIEFQPKELRLGLMEAASGKIGTVMDRLVLFCYRYDPETRKYSVYLTRLMQFAGGVTMILLGSYLLVFWRKQRKGVPPHAG